MDSITLPNGLLSVARIDSGQSSATPYRHDNCEYFLLEIPTEEIHELLKSNSLSLHSSLDGCKDGGATICSSDQTFLLRQVQTSNSTLILDGGSLMEVSCSHLEMLKIVPKYSSLLPLLNQYPWEGDESCDCDDDNVTVDVVSNNINNNKNINKTKIPDELRIDVLPYLFEGSHQETERILKNNLGAIPIGGYWRIIGDSYKESFLRELMANFVIGGDLLSSFGNNNNNDDDDDNEDNNEGGVLCEQDCYPHLPSHCSLEVGKHILSLFIDGSGNISKKAISQFFLDCLLRCRPVWAIDDLMAAWRVQMGYGAWGIQVRKEWIVGVGVVESTLMGLDADEFLFGSSSDGVANNFNGRFDVSNNENNESSKNNRNSINPSIRDVLKEGEHIRVSYFPSHKLPLDPDELFKMLWERKREWPLRQLEVYVERASKILRTKVKDLIIRHARIRGGGLVSPKYNF